MNEQDDRPASSSLPLPKRIGDFEILGKIGQGGMGAVFKARQQSLDRIVALKVLPPGIAKDKTFIERFVREARASARLSHPNVVIGIDVGQDAATGLWYFAMELVEGPTVKQLLRQKGRLPEDQALKIAREIAGALECARQNGIIHRDVKPDNILLDATGTAKLADLGLARRSNDDAHLTQSGTAMGTPHYMAPEQVRGEIDQLDTRADLYALGATLFHLVTGRTPFQGETSAVIMAKHLSEPPPVASRVCPDVSSGCARLIEKLMQKDKSQRFQTPVELIDQIDRLLETPVTSRSQTTGPRVPLKGGGTTGSLDSVRARRKQKAPGTANVAPYAGIGVAVIVLLVLAGLLLRPSGEPRSVARKDAKPNETSAPPSIPSTPAPPEIERTPAPPKLPVEQQREPGTKTAASPDEQGVEKTPQSGREPATPAAGNTPPPAPVATPEPPDAGQLALRQEAQKFSEILDRFDEAMLKARDVSAAARIAREAQGVVELEPFRAQAAALLAILDAEKVERKRQEETLAQLKGRTLVIGNEQLTIDRVADGILYAKIVTDGIVATKPLKLANLPDAQKRELFPPPEKIPDALRVAQALQELAKGPDGLAAAGDLLAAAPDFALTPHYQELIRSRKSAAMEALAKQAWDELVPSAERPLKEPEQALRVLEQLNAFSNTYGQSQFAAGHAAEIAALGAKLDQLANPNRSKNCKTLVSWVHLANLNQRGGSALTVQIGNQFDAIVYAEMQPGKWIAGSNFWHRTPKQQLAYAAETAPPATLVQMAIVYEDERISIYRNGESLNAYPAKNIDLLRGPGATVVFGLRHIGIPHGANLQGAIEDARVYDRCLSVAQIKNLAPNRPSIVPPWAWWDFEGGQAKDRMGRYTRNQFSGGAKVENGKLVLSTPDAALMVFADQAK